MAEFIFRHSWQLKRKKKIKLRKKFQQKNAVKNILCKRNSLLSASWRFLFLESAIKKQTKKEQKSILLTTNKTFHPIITFPTL